MALSSFLEYLKTKIAFVIPLANLPTDAAGAITSDVTAGDAAAIGPADSDSDSADSL